MIRLLARTVVSLVLAAIALVAIRGLWVRYEVDPVTRDGRVRADVIQVAPDVGGLVMEVHMVDNQYVHKGDPLLLIDQSHYRLAWRESLTTIASDQVALAQAEREDVRNHAMPDVIPTETTEEGREKVDALKVAVAAAQVARDTAALNLSRTVVRAPVDGWVTNMTLQPGNYLKAGEAAATLVDAHSLRIEGYFEETKLPAIHVGDPAKVRLMGYADPIIGHVESISAGVGDREREDSEATLANVNPAFTWVRLAQRIPVRVAIDHTPVGLKLIVGRTATVRVYPRPGDPVPRRSWPW